jgi:hypothetical protein
MTLIQSAGNVGKTKDTGCLTLQRYEEINNVVDGAFELFCICSKPEDI